MAIKKKHTRKSEKLYRSLTFESSLFNGEFTLPDMKQAPNHVIAAMERLDLNTLIDWCISAGAAKEDTEIFWEMDTEETKTFIEEWSHGTVGKF